MWSSIVRFEEQLNYEIALLSAYLCISHAYLLGNGSLNTFPLRWIRNNKINLGAFSMGSVSYQRILGD
jgi:hypothetical protein